VVSAFFVEKAEPPPRVLIVNLNLRAVAADGDASIVEAQLTKLVDPALWAPCSPCRIAEVCPLRRNAATLGDPVTGKIPRERLRRLFEVVHLRRHQHVTMRDLRSALSWFLLQDHDCQDIAAIEDQPDAPARFRALDYTQAFAADGPPTGDRVIKLLREIDVGLVELPDLDRRLNANPAKALSWIPFEGRGPSEGAWFGGFVQAGAPAAGDGLARALAERRTWMQAWRRKAYFERLDEGVRQQVPFLALESLEAAIWAGAGSEGEDARKALKDQLVEAISLLEGVRDPALRRANICLRSTRSKGSLAHSYRLFPAAQARLRLEAAGSLDRFMETAPDAVVLVVDTDQSTAELRLALDLVEMLLWVRRGYRPGPHDMGGLFVNLAIFRNSLLQLPYKEVLVSADGERFTTIAAAIEDGQIRFTARPVATQEGGAP